MRHFLWILIDSACRGGLDCVNSLSQYSDKMQFTQYSIYQRKALKIIEERSKYSHSLKFPKFI